MIKFTFTENFCRIIQEKKNSDTKKTLRSHHFIEGGKLGKYLSGILSIDNEEAVLGKKKTVHQ